MRNRPNDKDNQCPHIFLYKASRSKIKDKFWVMKIIHAS